MKPTPLTILIFFLSTFPGQSQTEESKKLSSLRAQFEELRADTFSERKKFEVRYAAELKALEEKAAAEGNLDLVLAVRSAIENFQKGAGAGEPSPKARLARLQEVYTVQIARIDARQKAKLQSLLAGYQKQLTDLKIELTKAGKIDAALATQAELKRLEEPSIASAPPKPETPSEFAASTPIAGFDLGQPGKLRGFGVMSPGTRDHGADALAAHDDIVEIIAAETGWQIRTTGGEMIGRQGDKTPLVECLGRGFVPWSALIRDGGKVWLPVKREYVDPQLYGGGRVKGVASCGNGTKLLLMEDGTLRVIYAPVGVQDELTELVKKARNVAQIDCTGAELFARTAEGIVFGWSSKATFPAGEKRVIDLTGLGEEITSIDCFHNGIFALSENGSVHWVKLSGGPKIEKPWAGELKNIRHIWAGGNCGVALDGDGRLHAWGQDIGSVGLVEKIKGLKGFKYLDIADRNMSTDGSKFTTYILWIE